MPAETYVYQVKTMHPTRLFWAAGLILVVLLVFSTLLWRLL
jgi:hypothetical protein